MKVIFLKNVKGVAQKDAVKEVSDGYAMNKLIPQGLAVRATHDALRELEQGKALSAESERKHDNELREKLSQLQQTSSISITNHQHAQGRLYHAVTIQEICHTIQSQHGIFVPKELIKNYEPIHEPGVYELEIGDRKQSIHYRVMIS